MISKAGELLAGLERADVTETGGPGRGNKNVSNVGNVLSDYRAVLDDTDTSYQQAHRWQKIAAMPERKAGELLAGLERVQGARTDLTLSNVGQSSEYAAVLEDTATNRQQAHRWQKIAAMPERKAGELLAGKMSPIGDISNAGHVTEYAQVLADTDTMSVQLLHYDNRRGYNVDYER